MLEEKRGSTQRNVVGTGWSRAPDTLGMRSDGEKLKENRSKDAMGWLQDFCLQRLPEIPRDRVIKRALKGWGPALAVRDEN